MGKQYDKPFRRLVSELGPGELRSWIVSLTIDAKYQVHIQTALTELGVSGAMNETEANLVIEGYVCRDDGAVGLVVRLPVGLVQLFPDTDVTAALAAVRSMCPA